jgi:hypothetical protein
MPLLRNVGAENNVTEVVSIFPFTNLQSFSKVERPGPLCMACRTLSTFSGVRALLRGPGGFLFVSLPVDLNDVTHRRMVLGVGMSP